MLMTVCMNIGFSEWTLSVDREMPSRIVETVTAN